MSVRFIAIFIILALLSACGGGSSNQTTGSSGTAPPPSNTKPVAVSLTLTVEIGQSVSGTLSATDTDGDPLSFVLVDAPQTGELNFNANGQFSYLATEQTADQEVRFSFYANDGKDNSELAWVTINLQSPANTAPVAENAVLSVYENGSALIQLVATDANNDELSFEITVQPEHGHAMINQTGQLVYANINGAGDTELSYRVYDGSDYSNEAIVVISSVEDIPKFGELGYKKYVQLNETVNGSFVNQYAAVAGGEPFDGSISLVISPNYGDLQVEGGKYTYTPDVANQNSVTSGTTDAFNYLVEKEGQWEGPYRIEFDFSEPGFVTQSPAMVEDLITEWRGEHDFPQDVRDILGGQDPFDEHFDFSDELFLSALQALSVLAEKSDASNQNIYTLGYYIRAWVYYRGPDALQNRQLQMLDRVAWQISQIDGFYGVSGSAALLHQSFYNVGYPLTYFDEFGASSAKYLALSEQLLAIYNRHPDIEQDYEFAYATFYTLDHMSRILSSFQYDAYIAYFDETEFEFNGVYTDSLLTELSHIAMGQLAQWGESEYFVANTALEVLGYLSNFTLAEWEEKSLTAARNIVTALLQSDTFGQQQQVTKINLYKYTLRNFYHYVNTERADLTCRDTLADICLIPSVDMALPNEHYCDEAHIFRYQALSQVQISGLCSALIETKDRFQLLLNLYEPVSDDFNDTLEFIIFDSRQQYVDWANALFDIDTSSGGIYLEGEPNNPENQARLIVYQQGDGDDWWVWNFEHEYIHYLDGRYVTYGNYGHYPLDKVTWWAEGLAEYLAWGNVVPRNSTVLTTTPEQDRPTLERILAADYSDSDITYLWTYAVQRYLAEDYPDLQIAMADCLRSNNLDCYLAQLNVLLESHTDSFNEWVNALSALLSTEVLQAKADQPSMALPLHSKTKHEATTKLPPARQKSTSVSF